MGRCRSAQGSLGSAAALATGAAAFRVDRGGRVDEPKGHLVKSPMSGRFIAPRARTPTIVDSAGGQARDTLCIIEAMKLLNEIEAEVAAPVKEILVENGQAVEYGQALF